MICQQRNPSTLRFGFGSPLAASMLPYLVSVKGRTRMLSREPKSRRAVSRADSAAFCTEDGEIQLCWFAENGELLVSNNRHYLTFVRVFCTGTVASMSHT